jgi:hypothetical protein
VLSASELSSTEYGNDCLNVRRGPAAFITSVMFSGDGFLASVCRTGRPRSVLAHIRGQHLHDRPVVFLRVPCDPLEGVDATQPDVHLLVAELLNRTREPLGDLPLL